jgi:hypothetical protein
MFVLVFNGAEVAVADAVEEFESAALDLPFVIEFVGSKRCQAWSRFRCR